MQVIMSKAELRTATAGSAKEVEMVLRFIK